MTIPTDSAGSGVDPCPDAVGSWRSVEELECGLAPTGEVLCQWSLDLAADGTFEWEYSDVGQSGTWTCAGGQIAAEGGGEIAGELVSGTELVWDGVTYEPDPAR